MDNTSDNDPFQQNFILFFKTASNYFYPNEQQRPNAFSFNLATILSTFSLKFTQRYWMNLRGYGINNNHLINNQLINNEYKKLFTFYATIDKKHPLYRNFDDKYKLNPSSKLFNAILPIILLFEV